MSLALELMIFIGLFALALGLLSSFIGETDSEKRRLRAEHEAWRLGLEPRRRDPYALRRSPVRQLTPTRPS